MARSGVCSPGYLALRTTWTSIQSKNWYSLKARAASAGAPLEALYRGSAQTGMANARALTPRLIQILLQAYAEPSIAVLVRKKSLRSLIRVLIIRSRWRFYWALVVNLTMLYMRSISANSFRHGHAPSLPILFLFYLKNQSNPQLISPCKFLMIDLVVNSTCWQ